MDRSNGICICTWELWRGQMAFERSCTVWHIHPRLKAHCVPSLTGGVCCAVWVLACLVGEEQGVGTLPLNLYFSYSKNHHVFENSGPQYFDLGEGLKGALSGLEGGVRWAPTLKGPLPPEGPAQWWRIQDEGKGK